MCEQCEHLREVFELGPEIVFDPKGVSLLGSVARYVAKDDVKFMTVLLCLVATFDATMEADDALDIMRRAFDLRDRAKEQAKQQAQSILLNLLADTEGRPH